MPGKGPRVFLDYDQAALDAAYDQAAYAPNREQLIKRRIRDSELARHRIGEPERVRVRTGRPSAPTMIQEIEFAPDSPLEGTGFEPLVPPDRCGGMRYDLGRQF
jgi:hypothetical protein